MTFAVRAHLKVKPIFTLLAKMWRICAMVEQEVGLILDALCAICPHLSAIGRI